MPRRSTAERAPQRQQRERKKYGGLEITIRPDTGALTIVGTVAGTRVRQRAATTDLKLAREEAAYITQEILRTRHLGERRGARLFSEAVKHYLATAPRRENTKALLARIVRAMGDRELAEIDQAMVNQVRQLMLAPQAAPATITRNLITPLRAVLSLAADSGWCDMPRFKQPRQPRGRTNFLTPLEVLQLLDAAPRHLRALIIFLVTTGARMSEALELEWRDVDLQGARARFWLTKGKPGTSGPRRDVTLPIATVLALAALPDKGGAVFRTDRGVAYQSKGRREGGQIKTGWRRAIAAAGLMPELTPHDLRHTWASWHYAVHKDLLALKTAGQWSSVALVERYAHLMPAGQERAIEEFWHGIDTGLADVCATA